MTLLKGIVAVIVLLALCSFFDRDWRLVAYYYILSNYLMLFPYIRTKQNKVRIQQEKIQEDDTQPLRRSRPKKETQRQLDSDLLNYLVKIFAQTCVEIVCAPYYFMRSYFIDEMK